ncbi:MAG: hypothetical protein J6V11_00260, partial [Alphaproteobacteria bacterium]|nr:hypothetical protein [Alphaproteobacteria bacterium]
MLKQALLKRSFWPMWGSHFISVINDGFIRTVFLFMATYKMTQTGTTSLITAIILYALFYCFGSLYAGQVADKLSRIKFLRVIRMSEIGLMLLALLFAQMESPLLLTLIIASMGLTGACLRVVNNALLPRMVKDADLNIGNLWMKLLSVVGSGFSVLFLTSILKFDAAAVSVCLVAVV